MDSSGNVIWYKEMSQTGSASSVLQISNDEYVIACGGFANLVKTDSEGVILWQENYGSYIMKSLDQTNDGGFILAGSIGSDGYLVKVNKDGDYEQQLVYPNTSFQTVQTISDGFIAAGICNGNIFLTKLSCTIPTTFLAVQVFDMDTADEFQVIINSKLIFTNPTDPTKNNIWTPLNLDLTRYVNFGSNLLILRNPTWAFAAVRNVQVTADGTILVNEPTSANLQHTEKEYPFTIACRAPVLPTELSLQVFDMDTAGEFQVLVNGNLIFSNPTDPTKNNLWRNLNFDITPYVGFGSNVVVLRNPTWAFCAVRNAKITVNGIVVVNNPASTNLQHNEKQYAFNI